jgi:hypothetical protein
MQAILGNKKTSNEIINDVIKMNPTKEPLTVEKLKTFKGFEQMNDEELKEYLHHIHQIAVIVVEHLRQQNGEVIEFDNQNKLAA